MLEIAIVHYTTRLQRAKWDDLIRPSGVHVHEIMLTKYYGDGIRLFFVNYYGIIYFKNCKL